MIRFRIFLSALMFIQLQAAISVQFTFDGHTYQIYNDLRSWNDIAATNTMPYIVEYNTVPEYSQLALSLGLGSLGVLFLRRQRTPLAR